MEHIWHTLFPELSFIENSKLQRQCAEVYEDACRLGGWAPSDMDLIPFTLNIPGAPSLRAHVRTVTQLAHHSHAIYSEVHCDSKLVPCKDTLLAGALLHDVGKLLEYTRTNDGGYAFSEFGKAVRHPFSGAALALKHQVPTGVVHVIAAHAREGDGTPRSVEALLVNKIDSMHYESLRVMLCPGANL